MNSAPGLRLLVAPSCAGSPLSEQLSDAVRDGLGADAASALTALVLPAGPIRAEDQALIDQATDSATAGSTIVPVVIGHEASHALPDVSQLIVAGRDAAWVTDRLGRLMAASGRDLIALQDLHLAATRWDATGRPPAALLGSAAAAEALALLPVAAKVGWVDVPLVTSFVDASARHQRGRQRRLLGGLAVASVILLVLGVVALLSRVEAAAAADQARAQAAISTSSRLVRQVDDMLGASPGPDLPQLLIAEALRADASPAALATARRVVELIPVHRSVTLPAPAREVSVDRAGTLTVATLFDGRVTIVSGEEVTRTVAPVAADDIAIPVVHPDGTNIALLTREAVHVVEVQGDRPPERVAAASEGGFLGRWVDGGLVVLNDHGPTLLDPQAGTAQPWGELPWRDDVRAADLSPDGSVLALVSPSHGVWIGDPRSGTATYVSDDTSVQDVTLGGTGTAVLRRAGGSSRLDLVSGDTITEPTRALQGALVAGPAGGLARLGRDGTVCYLEPATGRSAFCHPAHAGGVIDLAVSDTAAYTVGFDTQLRIWQHPETPRYLSPEMVSSTDDIVSRQIGNDPAARAQLVVAPAGSHGALFLPMRGMIGTFNPATLEARDTLFYRLWLKQYLAVLSSDARSLGAVWEKQAEVIDLDGGTIRWRLEQQLPFTAGQLLTPLVAVSADGLVMTYQFAGSGYMISAESARGERYAAAHNPIAAQVADGVLTLITADGVLSRDGRQTLLVRAPDTVVAAAFAEDGRPVVVDSTGTVLRFPDGVRNEVMTLPSGFRPLSVRVSADGQRIALVGADRTLIVAAETGATLLDVRPAEAGAVVQDVAFLSSDAVLLARADGGLQRRDALDDDALAGVVGASAPRELTTAERDQFGIG